MTVGDKELPQAVIERSVISRPEDVQAGSLDTSLLWFVANAADEMTAWGVNPKRRDRELREFVPTENYFASALGIVCARNMAFSWTVEGSPRVAARFQEMLDNANMGEGWQDFIAKISYDLYTQDSGAFFEIVREADRPDSPAVGINHLDAQRCFHTGNVEKPVVYIDRKGKYHQLNWWQVVTLAEMPVPIETAYGFQLVV